ncbi:MAG: flagellar basal body-associated FliL family protein [Methylomicrobium sp.]
MRLLVLLLSFLFLPSWADANESGSGEGGMEYLEITPKITVNLAEPRHYLLVNVQLLTDGAEAIEKIKKHMPAVKHELIMLFSGRPSDSIQTMEQREALRKETVAVMQKTLDKYEKNSGFRDAFFSEFLISY